MTGRAKPGTRAPFRPGGFEIASLDRNVRPTLTEEHGLLTRTFQL